MLTERSTRNSTTIRRFDIIRAESRMKTLLTLCALLWPAAVSAQPAPAAKIQTLLITGQNGHDWQASPPKPAQGPRDHGPF